MFNISHTNVILSSIHLYYIYTHTRARASDVLTAVIIVEGKVQLSNRN